MRRQRREADGLVKLVNYRWAVPVMAELSANSGSKVVTLCHRLGVSRQSLQRSLASLIEQGLVEPNPGYGHPMRPEYVLTKLGRTVGAASQRLVGATRTLDLQTIAFQKWSLPVVHSLGGGANRFRAIQTSLPSITSRALSLALKDLGTASVLERTVGEEYPPTSEYTLTQVGKRIAPLVDGVVVAYGR